MAGGAACAVCGSVHAKRLSYGLAATEIGSGSYAVHGSTDYFSLDNGGNIVNTAFVAVPDGVVVIDTGPSKRYGEALRALIEKTLPGKPILRVYNTHHHPDHFLGNQVFAPETIAATQKIIDNINAEGDGFADNMYRLVGDWMRGTAPVAPTVVVEGTTEQIGGRQFSIHQLSGHTSSDLVIRDDETGIVYTGDLAFLNRAPTTPHASIAQWHESLAFINGLDREVILPGHGVIDPDGESIVQTGDYLDWLDNTIRDSALRGLTMNEAMQISIPARFASLDVVQTEYQRSVVHLYLQLEDELMPIIEPKR